MRRAAARPPCWACSSTGWRHNLPKANSVSTTELRKAAVLLMSLPQDEAARILARLDPLQAEAVTAEIAKSGPLAPDEQSSVIRQFADADRGASGRGGLHVAQNLVEQAFGKNENTLRQIRQSIGSLPFRFLRQVDTKRLLICLADEHPQTIAVVLAHLPAAQAAKILAGLPVADRAEILRRIAGMDFIDSDVVHEVARGLERRLSYTTARHGEPPGGLPLAAEIVNASERAVGQGLLNDLARDNPTLAAQLSHRMFACEDIGSLADATRTTAGSSHRSSAVRSRT